MNISDFHPSIIQRIVMAHLTLHQKISILKDSDGKRQTELAKEYNVSRGTIQNILKRKAELMEAFEDNQPAERKRRKPCKFGDVDRLVWEWFKTIRTAG